MSRAMRTRSGILLLSDDATTRRDDKNSTYLIGVLPPFAFDDSGRVVVARLIDDNQFVERFDARVDTKSQKLRIVLNS